MKSSKKNCPTKWYFSLEFVFAKMKDIFNFCPFHFLLSINKKIDMYNVKLEWRWFSIQSYKLHFTNSMIIGRIKLWLFLRIYYMKISNVPSFPIHSCLPLGYPKDIWEVSLNKDLTISQSVLIHLMLVCWFLFFLQCLVNWMFEWVAWHEFMIGMPS